MNRTLMPFLKVATVAFVPTILFVAMCFSGNWLQETRIDTSLLIIVMFSLACFLGSAISGVMQHLGELDPSTRQWLVHRGLSGRQLFATRVLANSLVFGLGVPLLLAGILLLDRDVHSLGDLLTDDRFLGLLPFTTLALTGYASGAFLLSPQGGLLRAMSIGALAITSVALGSIWLLTPNWERAEAPMYVFVLFQFVSSAAMLASAGARALSPVDRDRPEPLRASIVGNTVAIIVACAAAIAVICRVSHEFDPADSLPFVAEHPTEGLSLVLTGRHQTVSTASDRYTPSQQFQPTHADGLGHPTRIADVNRYLARGNYDYAAVRYNNLSGGKDGPSDERLGAVDPRWIRIEARDGFLRVDSAPRRIGDDSEIPGKHSRFAKPNGSFSHRTSTLGQTSKDSITQYPVVDPQDGTVWVVSDREEGFVLENIPFPNGDRLLGTEFYAEGLDTFSIPHRGHLLYGRDACYDLYDGVLREVGPLPEPVHYDVTYTRLEEYANVRVDVRKRDTQKLAFTHTFSLRTAEQLRRLSIVKVLSCLRPPALSLAAHFTSTPANASEDFALAIVRDPIVMDGRGRGVILAMISVAAILASLATRRLRTFGAERGRIAFWAIAILASGPIGYLIYRTAETNRAWAQPDDDSDEVPLLIRSVA